MAFHSIIEQGAQGARPVRRYFAKPLERIPRVFALFSLFGTNLQCGEIKLIEVVVWFFLCRSCKLFLLLGKISFRTRQPACNHMKSCAVAIYHRDSIERFPRKIELPKPQRSGSVVELARAIIWSQSRYALTPRNGVFKILLLRCVREDRQRLERIRIPRPELSRHLRCLAEFSFLQQCSCPIQQTVFTPVLIQF